MSAALKPFIGRTTPYQCPDCEVAMTPYSCDGSIVHKCAQCHGLWLTGRRIGTLRDALDKFDFSEFAVDLHSALPKPYTIHCCPRCRQVLEEQPYAYNSGVYVNRCLRCRGIWLPLPELIRLMQSVKLKHSVIEDVRGLLSEMNKMHLGPRPFMTFLRFLKSIT